VVYLPFGTFSRSICLAQVRQTLYRRFPAGPFFQSFSISEMTDFLQRAQRSGLGCSAVIFMLCLPVFRRGWFYGRFYAVQRG
jgi:hypothetical protein